jgi:hypothetical protein
VGAQNDLRYAVFPGRLVIKDGEQIGIAPARAALRGAMEGEDIGV